MVVAREQRQADAGDEKASCQKCGQPRQRIGCAAAGHEPAATAAADPKAAALGALQHDRADQGQGQHEMNDEQNSLHGVTGREKWGRLNNELRFREYVRVLHNGGGDG